MRKFVKGLRRSLFNKLIFLFLYLFGAFVAYGVYLDTPHGGFIVAFLGGTILTFIIMFLSKSFKR